MINDLGLCGEVQNRCRANFPSQREFFTCSLVGNYKDWFVLGRLPQSSLPHCNEGVCHSRSEFIGRSIYLLALSYHSSCEDGAIFKSLSTLVLYFNKSTADRTGVNEMITKWVLVHSTASSPKGTMALSTMHTKLERSKNVGCLPWGHLPPLYPMHGASSRQKDAKHRDAEPLSNAR